MFIFKIYFFLRWFAIA